MGDVERGKSRAERGRQHRQTDSDLEESRKDAVRQMATALREEEVERFSSPTR